MKKFHLSAKDKKIAGVCGGIAEYFKIDSLIVRIAFVVLVLCCGIGAIAYIVLALLAPKA
ncbi:MAG: PspC domain-containing protein [Bacteroidales bacterium]|nr:PspC domain-containing protein [Bacteroidales bacterium]